MPSCKDTIFVERPIEKVFDVATTAKYWTTWHPMSKGVNGAIDHPMQLNDKINELVVLAGRKQWTEWTVTEHTRPRTLRLDGKSMGVKSYIEYTLIERDGGTEYTRFFWYKFHPLLKLAELLIKSTLRKLQTEAMDHMKEFLLKEIPK